VDRVDGAGGARQRLDGLAVDAGAPVDRVAVVERLESDAVELGARTGDRVAVVEWLERLALELGARANR
jgi:hypothetical protein